MIDEKFPHELSEEYQNVRDQGKTGGAKLGEILNALFKGFLERESAGVVPTKPSEDFPRNLVDESRIYKN